MGASFADTNWWVVHRAAHPEEPQADAARANLYRTYWRPIYDYVRRSGYGHEDAQDLAQEFFARLLEKNYLQAAAPEKGRFRSYLLLLLKRFLADQWDRAHRQKRGGGQPAVSLDAADTRFFPRVEPADDFTPDKLFDRAWAASLLANALQALREECRAAGKGELFDALRPFLAGEKPARYAEVSTRLGLRESYAKVLVHRLRRRLRALVRAEIARTARSREEVETELRDLQAILAGAAGPP